MGKLNRYSVHTRELTPQDWPSAVINNQVLTSSNASEFFSLAASASGQVVNDITAKRVSAVMACVEKIAVISSLPKHIYQRNKDGEPERVDHPLWRLLNVEANNIWTAASFWEIAIQSLLLRGDFYAEIVSTKTGKIIGLKPIECDYVTPLQRDNGDMLYRVNSVSGVTTYDASSILHFPGFGFNGFHGMSVIKYSARNGVGIALAADAYSSEFFANGQRPDYVLTTDGSLTPQQKTDVKTSLEEQLQGVGRRHKPLVLQGGLKIQPISMTAEDSQLLETRRFQVIDICMAFGVPPQLIGAQDSTAGWAGSSLEQLNLGFTKYTLQPLIVRITQEINRKLLANTPYFVEFNLDAFLAGDAKTQAEYFSKAVGGPGQQGWMSVNEVRRLKNLKKDDNARYNSVIESGSLTQQGSNNESTVDQTTVA